MRSSTKIASLNAAQVLRAEGLISAEQVDQVVEEAQSSGERIADVLIARGFATEYDLAKAMVSELGLPFLSPKNYDSPNDISTHVPSDVARTHRIVPLDVFNDVLVIATYADVDAQALTDLESDSGKRIACVIALKTDIEKVLNDRYPQEDLGKEVASRLDQLFGG